MRDTQREKEVKRVSEYGKLRRRERERETGRGGERGRIEGERGKCD